MVRLVRSYRRWHGYRRPDDKEDDIYDIVVDAIEEFRQRMQEAKEEGRFRDIEEPNDIIFEIADSHVPIYTSDLLRLASENTEFALSEPDISPAFGGRPTPVNIIAANIFEKIEQSLWEEWRTNFHGAIIGER